MQGEDFAQPIGHVAARQSVFDGEGSLQLERVVKGR